MGRLSCLLAGAVVAAAGCGGHTGDLGDGGIVDSPIDSLDDPPIDASRIDAPIPIDAPTDAAGCGNQVLLQGYYLDWDSTLNNPIGLGGARWSVVGDPTRTVDAQPSGLVSMCLAPGAPSRIQVSGPAGYVGAVFVADPAVFAPPNSRFIVRGVQLNQANAQYQEFLTPPDGYNSGRAQVEVYNLSANTIPLTLGPALNPPQRSFVNGGNFNDITWAEGDTGRLTLFPNRPFGAGTATLSSTAAYTGPTDIPLANGAFTIVAIRSN